jgi:riboflavin kinase/FMN adenylyltransferase
MSPQPTKPPFVIVNVRSAHRGIGALAGGGGHRQFPGVHRGHRAVIGAAVARARGLGRPAAALTFEPHPRAFFNPDQPLFRLTDAAAKLRLLAATALDGAILMEFDAALAALDPAAFVAHVLVERYAISGA